MAYTKQEFEQMVRSVPYWWHSIDLGQGVVTSGGKHAAQLKDELEKIRLPDLRGKSVLDIGAYDGFFSFEAERRGASRVVALDHFVWGLDLKRVVADWQGRKASGVPGESQPEVLRPDLEKLPGMAAYRTAHQALDSKVETVVADYMTEDHGRLGTFDVVLYLGVLYHMEDPLASLKRVAALTRELAIIETEAMALPGHEGRALAEFFEGSEFNGDQTNWWSPNEKAIVGLCHAAGFSRVETIVGSPLRARPRWKATARTARSSAGVVLRNLGVKRGFSEIVRYRAIIHAWK